MTRTSAVFSNPRRVATFLYGGLSILLAVLCCVGFCGVTRAANDDVVMLPKQVAGLDPQSRAIVTVNMGELTLDIPRKLLSGMFFGPIYCPSGRGVCGQRASPDFALLYPDLTPIPESRIAEFRVLSPSRHPDLIYAIVLGQDEPERVANFLGNLKAEELKKGPYGLYLFPGNKGEVIDGMFLAFPDTPDRLAINCPSQNVIDPNGQCNASKYLFGDISFVFQFNSSLLPYWAEINDKISRLLESLRRG